MRRSLIDNAHYSVGIYHSHFRTNTRRGSFIKGDIVIHPVQTILDDIRFENMVFVRFEPFQAIQPNRVHSFIFQRFLQESHPLLQPHITVEQVFIDRFQMEIRSNSSRNIVNFPRHTVGRCEEHTLLIVVETKQ